MTKASDPVAYGVGMKIADLLKEQSEYMAALYSIVFMLQIKEFERTQDPIGTAIATARAARDKLLNCGCDDDAMSRLVVEFFDQVVADLQSRSHREPDATHRSPGGPPRPQ